MVNKMDRLLIKKEQLDFLDWEFGIFFHFGIRTFYEGHTDWDLKEMPLEGFNPTELDCESWIKTISQAGAKYAVLVCKHHDGFANWPSKYTDYSVKNTPWKNGQGDVVGEFVSACRKYDVKVALYYSPAQFGSVKMNHSEYDEYFINQISELLTDYGRIDYLWFDGCGSEGHEYDFERITAKIRELQPEILIFNMGDPDTLWCGNESGYAEMPNYNFRDYNGEKRFLPLECDCKIRGEWFYSDADVDKLKSVDELMGMYLYSVGRGANLLLNIGPDRRGLLCEDDERRLFEFSAEIKNRFGTPLKTVLNPEAESNRISVCFEDSELISAVILKEDVEVLSPVEQVKIFASIYGNDDELFITSAQSIGHKLILTFPPIRARRITAEFDRIPQIKELSIY